jgi:hypothetical protein
MQAVEIGVTKHLALQYILDRHCAYQRLAGDTRERVPWHPPLAPGDRAAAVIAPLIGKQITQVETDTGDDIGCAASRPALQQYAAVIAFGDTQTRICIVVRRTARYPPRPTGPAHMAQTCK